MAKFITDGALTRRAYWINEIVTLSGSVRTLRAPNKVEYGMRAMASSAAETTSAERATLLLHGATDERRDA